MLTLFSLNASSSAEHEFYVDVSVNGLLIGQKNKSRFIAWDDVSDIERGPPNVFGRVILASGEIIDLDRHHGGKGGHEASARLQALRQAMRRYGHGSNETIE